MSDASVVAEGTLLAERYVIKKRLGGGGMGAVYLAQDQINDQPVALKLLAPPKGPLHSPQILQRMQREIKVLMLAEDPRVIALLDWGKDPKHGLFYTMEMLEEAVDLDTHLKQHRPAFWERLRLFQECLLGLLALHEIKAIHRDIKPQNILCVGDKNQPAIKWIDPGIAKWFPDDLRTQVTVETAPGALLGTPLYMAPEMWMGDSIDARTDIYQCGIMGFEMLVLRRPFVGNFPRLMHQHLLTPMPSLLDFVDDLPPDIPPDALQILDRVIQKATQKSPNDRFQDLRAFCYALQPAWPYALASIRPSAPPLPVTDAPPQGLLPSGIIYDAVLQPEALAFAETSAASLPLPSNLFRAETQHGPIPSPPHPHEPSTTQSRYAALMPLLVGFALSLLAILVFFTKRYASPKRPSDQALTIQPPTQNQPNPQRPSVFSPPHRLVPSSLRPSLRPPIKRTTDAAPPQTASPKTAIPTAPSKTLSPPRSLIKKTKRRKKAEPSILNSRPQWNDTVLPP
ncbi:serine/threonine protein kinase [Myxococcota bacterium]|nr:serine/threonine protein kinase [Myxococcota bacterium]